MQNVQDMLNAQDVQNVQDYARRLRLVRQELKLTINEMAELLGVSARTLGGYEREERTVAIEVVTKLCIKANVDGTWFLTGLGSMFYQPGDKMILNISKEEFYKMMEEFLSKKNSVLV